MCKPLFMLDLCLLLGIFMFIYGGKLLTDPGAVSATVYSHPVSRFPSRTCLPTRTTNYPTYYPTSNGRTLRSLWMSRRALGRADSLWTAFSAFLTGLPAFFGRATWPWTGSPAARLLPLGRTAQSSPNLAPSPHVKLAFHTPLPLGRALHSTSDYGVLSTQQVIPHDGRYKCAFSLQCCFHKIVCARGGVCWFIGSITRAISRINNKETDTRSALCLKPIIGTSL